MQVRGVQVSRGPRCILRISRSIPQDDFVNPASATLCLESVRTPFVMMCLCVCVCVSCPLRSLYSVFCIRSGADVHLVSGRTCISHVRVQGCICRSRIRQDAFIRYPVGRAYILCPVDRVCRSCTVGCLYILRPVGRVYILHCVRVVYLLLPVGRAHITRPVGRGYILHKVCVR